MRRHGGSITIPCRAELNRAIASALCPEPPAGEAQAVRTSGVWNWRWDEIKFTGRKGHWEPIDFCSDPAASYLLRQRMRELGWRHSQADHDTGTGRDSVRVRFHLRSLVEYSEDGNEMVAQSRAAGTALGLQLDFQEGWDTR